VQYPSAMRVGHRVADVDKPAKQFPQFQCAFPRVAGTAGSIGMELGNRFLQGNTADEAHRVVGAALFVVPQAVDGHDSWMFEPAGYLGFQQEARPTIRIIGAFRLDLLEGDLALQLGVERNRDDSNAPAGMGMPDLEPISQGIGYRQARWISSCP